MNLPRRTTSRFRSVCWSVLSLSMILAMATCSGYEIPSPVSAPVLTPAQAEASEKQAVPVLAEPLRGSFEVELVADLHAALGRRPKVFQLVLTNGEHGFPPGMYMTTGPAGDDRSDRLLYMGEPGKIEIVKDGFRSNMTLVFARGEYGEGMLITEPLEMRIRRLLPDGTVTTFASLGTEPFGPAGLAYGPDNALYVTDSAAKRVLRVEPDGSSSVIAKARNDDMGDYWTALLFASPDEVAAHSITFLVGAYNYREANTGGIASYSTEGGGGGMVSRQVVGGLNGVELLAYGPGGAFGNDIFVPSVGGAENRDGALYTMSAEGTLTPFMTGLDAVSVVFDTDNILGGGMFVADINDGGGGGRIWRVTSQRQGTSDMMDGAIETMEAVIQGEVSGKAIRGLGRHVGDPWAGTNSALILYEKLPLMKHSWKDEVVPFVAPSLSPLLFAFRDIVVTDEPI